MKKPRIIQSVSTHVPKLKIVVYADCGVGKTRFAGTAADVADMGKVLVIRAEDGVSTITNKPDIMITPHVECHTEVAGYIANLAQGRKSTTTYIDENGDAKVCEVDFSEFKTVILDSGTALQQTILEYVVSTNNKEFPTFQEYNQCTFVMTKLVRQLFNLDMHVIMTALVRTDTTGEPPNKRDVAKIPDFMPKIGKRVQESADFVWYMKASTDKEKTRTLHTQPAGIWKAKTRGDVFAAKIPDTMKNPSLSGLLKALNDAQKVSS